MMFSRPWIIMPIVSLTRNQMLVSYRNMMNKKCCELCSQISPRVYNNQNRQCLNPGVNEDECIGIRQLTYGRKIAKDRSCIRVYLVEILTKRLVPCHNLSI